MRICQIIGRVTLNVQDPSYQGGRWLLANPLDPAQLAGACAEIQPVTGQFTMIAYDSLGAGPGDVVGIVEGAEAMAPFDFPIPIDAITVAIFDTIHYQPPTSDPLRPVHQP
jgi:microcompartment protein CcmK/EutM